MKSAIEQFLNCKNIAIVGMSSCGPKFGNLAYKELSKKDFKLFPVHPTAKKIDGAVCYSSIHDIKDNINGILISIPPEEAEKVAIVAHQNGIRNIWLQRGAQSDSAIKYCHDKDINVVHNECILMHAEPVKGFHKFHQVIWKFLGKIPK